LSDYKGREYATKSTAFSDFLFNIGVKHPELKDKFGSRLLSVDIDSVQYRYRNGELVIVAFLEAISTNHGDFKTLYDTNYHMGDQYYDKQRCSEYSKDDPRRRRGKCYHPYESKISNLMKLERQHRVPAYFVWHTEDCEQWQVLKVRHYYVKDHLNTQPTLMTAKEFMFGFLAGL